MEQKCPHCGASLPEGASFCPHCASSINQRSKVEPPRPFPRKVLYALIALIAAAAVGLGIFCYTRPQTLDGIGEVIYTDKDGTYQLLFAWPNRRFEPIPQMVQPGEAGGEYRFPMRMYVNHVESGADAGPVFTKKVESVTAELIQKPDLEHPMVCSQPEPKDFDPKATYISLIDFIGGEQTAQLVFTLNMKNGDVITLRSEIITEVTHTFEYHWDETPMDTLAQVQTVIDEAVLKAERTDTIDIYLAPVTYEGNLSIRTHGVNLIGSTDETGQQRTAFAGTIYIPESIRELSYIRNIDFPGRNGGIAISAASNLHVEDCSFTNWKTAVLGYGAAWVNIRGSVFVENEVGFHFNSEGTAVTHTQYDHNRFLYNGTAILLERVPTDVSISFNDTLFESNGTDINNICQQAIDISKAEIR